MSVFSLFLQLAYQIQQGYIYAQIIVVFSVNYKDWVVRACLKVSALMHFTHSIYIYIYILVHVSTMMILAVSSHTKIK